MIGIYNAHEICIASTHTSHIQSSHISQTYVLWPVPWHPQMTSFIPRKQGCVTSWRFPVCLLPSYSAPKQLIFKDDVSANISNMFRCIWWQLLLLHLHWRSEKLRHVDSWHRGLTIATRLWTRWLVFQKNVCGSLRPPKNQIQWSLALQGFGALHMWEEYPRRIKVATFFFSKSEKACASWRHEWRLEMDWVVDERYILARNQKWLTPSGASWRLKRGKRRPATGLGSVPGIDKFIDAGRDPTSGIHPFSVELKLVSEPVPAQHGFQASRDVTGVGTWARIHCLFHYIILTNSKYSSWY